MKQTSIKKVAKGDYIKRKADSKIIYIKGDYDRATGSFSCVDINDICREIFIKANKIVISGFTY